MSETKTVKKLDERELNALKEQLKEELRAELRGNGIKNTPAQHKADPYLEEYVEIQLFKDGKDYKDDVFVSCNGENCLIKRGVPVKIKRKFALILEQSAQQDVSAAEYAEERRREYSSQVRMLGI